MTDRGRLANAWGPEQWLTQYLLWHATSICHGTCLLCVDTRVYLVAHGADLSRLDALLTSPRGGTQP